MANLRDTETQIKIVELVEALRNGEDVSSELIQLHKKYVEGTAWRFGWKLLNLRSDIRSAALLGLTQAVHWIANGRCEHTDYTAYIIRTCIRFIRDEISNSYGVYVPDSSISAGIVDGYATVLSYDNPIDIAHHSNQIFGADDRGRRDYFAVRSPKDQSQEIKEELDSVKLTWKQRHIIEMRLDGFNDAEIGKTLYVSKMRISQIRADIQTKFQHLLKGKVR